MNRKILSLSFCMLLASLNIVAQTDLKGLWNGVITTDNYNAHARYMISIEEHKDGIVSGRALLYKPNLFSHAFGLQQFYGTIENGVIIINDIQILDQRMPSDPYYLCFKLSKLNYNKSDSLESLSGDWTSATTNCLPGKVFLTRFNEKKNTTKVPDYVLNAIKRDGNTPAFKKTKLSPPLVFEVKSSFLRLQLQDYLKEDNDTVSVYLNRQLVIKNLRIKKKPQKFVLLLDRDLPVNEIIMYANNLGQVPPNTSNLMLYDGTATHKVLIESTLQKSVAIYLKYTPK
jgi:hypothetical protein